MIGIDKSTHSLPYRPDIDGLRAIAVLLVIAYHTFPSQIPGGFIGVDIFFIISGFLITSIILKDIQANTFSFTGFYARRIRRIFPALICVLLFCLVFGWFVLFPLEYTQLGRHTAAGTAFIYNFTLRSEGGYFAAAVTNKPLSHLWSLSIEEQFYVVWPLLMYSICKLGRHRIKILAVVVIVLFFISHLQSENSPEAGYLMPHARFWELAVGSMLACYLLYKKVKPCDEKTKGDYNVMSFFGMILILFCGATFAVFLPRWLTLLPVIATVLIISAGNHAWINRKILSSRILVGLGLISYPLYLWHWPLLAFIHITHPAENATGLKIVSVLLSFLLAYITYRLVEKPLRYRPLSGVMVFSLVFILSSIGVFGYATYTMEGYKNLRSDVKQQNNFLRYFDNSPPYSRYANNTGLFKKYRMECDFYDTEKSQMGASTIIPRSAIDKTCYQRDYSYPHAVLIWGDSHAQHLSYGLTKKLPDSWQILQIASSGCSPPLQSYSIFKKCYYCTVSNAFTLKTIREAMPSVVIIAQDNDYDYRAVHHIHQELRSMGVKKVIFVGPTPHWKSSLPNIIVRYLWSDERARTWTGLNKSVMDLNTSLQKSFNDNHDMIYANVINVFCNQDGCLTHIGDDVKEGITSMDSGHLTPIASEFLAQELLVKLITDEHTLK